MQGIKETQVRVNRSDTAQSTGDIKAAIAKML